MFATVATSSPSFTRRIEREPQRADVIPAMAVHERFTALAIHFTDRFSLRAA